MDPINQRSATRTLMEAERRRWQTERGGPNEHAIAAVCGVLVFMLLALFDFFPARIAGSVMFGVAALGITLGMWYATWRALRVLPSAHVRRRNNLLWLVWSLWYLLVLTAALWLDNRLPLRYTVAGLLDALPLLIRGTRGLRKPGWL